jgi:uncharacterized membrane protein
MTWPKKISLAVMALFYFGGGVNHLVNPDVYVAIMPPSIPSPYFMQGLAGVVEIAVALGFVVPKTRLIAAVTTIAMLGAFMSVHIYHLQLGGVPGAPQVPLWALWIRVPLQFAFGAWAWWHRR